MKAGKMKSNLMVVALAATVAGLGPDARCAEKFTASAISPDGKNKISLSFNPLAYTVTREGKTVVAKTAIGMTIDGKELAACPDNIGIASVKIEGEADAVLAASVFHFGTYTIRQVKEYMASQGIPVRLDF
jgi:hypothetical protein